MPVAIGQNVLCLSQFLGIKDLFILKYFKSSPRGQLSQEYCVLEWLNTMLIISVQQTNTLVYRVNLYYTITRARLLLNYLSNKYQEVLPK